MSNQVEHTDELCNKQIEKVIIMYHFFLQYFSTTAIPSLQDMQDYVAGRIAEATHCWTYGVAHGVLLVAYLLTRTIGLSDVIFTRHCIYVYRTILLSTSIYNQYYSLDHLYVTFQI